MGFLRRLLGGRRWFDYPPGGAVDVAGAYHRLEAWQRAFRFGPAGDTRVAQAELIREPTNRHDHNAVMVVVRGEHVGYLPAEVALLWSPYLVRMESDGYRVRATVKVWGRMGKGHSTPMLGYEGASVLVDPHPLTPAEWEIVRAEEKRRADERAAEIAARDAQKVERQHERAASAARKVLESERRASGVCINCGGPIVRQPGARGRMAVRCAACRASAGG
jgi:hypothetical protein